MDATMAKILIIEDEAAIAELEKDYLELSDFEVTLEKDGSSGAARALAEDFDLIILDLMLPGMDGFEICKLIRETKNTPIIILDEATAFADPDNEAQVQAAFSELAKGKTVIMIAHRLSTVAHADCIYVLSDGQIAESGRRAELCEQGGLFARMWKDYQTSIQWKVAKEG